MKKIFGSLLAILSSCSTYNAYVKNKVIDDLKCITVSYKNPEKNVPETKSSIVDLLCSSQDKTMFLIGRAYYDSESSLDSVELRLTTPERIINYNKNSENALCQKVFDETIYTFH